MSWTYCVAGLSDIDIKIHVTFVIIPVLVGLEWGRKHGAAGFACRQPEPAPEWA